jgi:hypothetical protein
MGLSGKSKVSKFKIPMWALIVLNVVALGGGIVLGSGAIDVLMSEPETKSRISAIRPGETKTGVIDWPLGNFTGGQLSMVVDVGVNNSIANDVIVSLDIIDPEDAAKSYPIIKLDQFDIKRADGLMYASKAVNLIPVLKDMRGMVRDFKVRKVTLRAHVERKVPTSTSAGLVFVTNASVLGKPVLQQL